MITIVIALQLDRHGDPTRCEVVNCANTAAHERYIGRRAIRVDVCDQHNDQIDAGARVFDGPVEATP